MAEEARSSSQSAWIAFGATLRTWRQQREMSLRDLAKQIRWDHSLIGKWERGKNPPPVEAVKTLETVLDADGELTTAALHAAMADIDRLRTLARNGTPDEENATERRRLLQLAAASAGMGALSAAGEPVRQLLHMDLSEPRSIEDWELTCTDHLRALHTRPAAQARDDLQIDLAELQQQLRTTSTSSEMTELRRVVAALSTLHANVLSRLGEHGPALRWWRTARTAADATGDLHLQLGVRATEAGHVRAHGQRDPSTVVHLTQQAQRIAGDASSLGTAFVLCSQAKALTDLGRHEDARKALNTCRALMESEPPAASIMPSVWHMRGGQREYAELYVNAGAGDENATADARDRVLAIVGDYQYRVTSQLHIARCLVVRGGVEEGLRHAASVIDGVSPQYRTHLINETGRMVLRAVPVDQSERPTVGEFRELLAIEPPARN